MKGDPAVIERAITGYSGDWRLHVDGQNHKFTLRRWMKSCREIPLAIGAVIAATSLAVWSYLITTNHYAVDTASTPIMLIVCGVSTIVIPYLFGFIKATPLIRDKRRYCTTTEYAYYWRANKSLRAGAPDSFSPDEFALIIEAAQRVDRKVFRLRCIDRLAESIDNWKADGKLPTVPEETVFIEELRTAVLSDPDTPIV